MAVYTHLGAEDLAQLVAQYDVGELVSFKGIAEGVSNSNWLVETMQGRFILTMYERRIELAELPFFLGLLDHLSAAGCPVPRTIHDRAGEAWRMVGDKAIALIEFLPGLSPSQPTRDQAFAVGRALAEMHRAGARFPMRRENRLAPPDTLAILRDCGATALAAIDPHLPAVLDTGAAIVEAWPDDLPQSVIHSDLFPDNVLMLGDQVTGMIDFYFACDGAMAYDLAVTHAAWSFDESGKNCDRPLGEALVEGYESVRPLENGERTALPLLAEGACLRFVTSRAQDWLDTPEDALVRRKDPMDFVRRLEFYRANGQRAFA